MSARIIIGYDGSPNSDDAVLLGRQLCELLGAEPVVFYCFPIQPYLMGYAGDQEGLDEAVRAATEPTLKQALEGLEGLDARTEATAAPSPAGALFELAAREQPTIVVVGSSHRGPLGRILLGSVGQRLVEGLSCAVAVAPRGYASGAGEAHLSRLGVAVDGGPESDAALSVGVSLAEGLEAGLRLISVQELPQVTYSATPGVAVVELDGAAERHASTVLKDALEAVPASVPTDTAQPKGDPATRLEEASRDLDLMIVGSRGYGPVSRVLLGSVSARLMRTAHCPLLLIPRAAGEAARGMGAAESAAGAR
jgi:nucleotide-binding universal stress UspA family protein